LVAVTLATVLVAAASVAGLVAVALAGVLAVGANRRRQARPAQHVAVYSFYKEIKSEQ
jgi:hypothetical protein